MRKEEEEEEAGGLTLDAKSLHAICETPLSSSLLRKCVYVCVEQTVMVCERASVCFQEDECEAGRV